MKKQANKHSEKKVISELSFGDIVVYFETNSDTKPQYFLVVKEATIKTKSPEESRAYYYFFSLEEIQITFYLRIVDLKWRPQVVDSFGRVVSERGYLKLEDFLSRNK